MKQFFIPVLFLLSACAMEQKHSGTVNFQITVDQIVLSKYFAATCQKDFPLALPEELDACVTLRIGEFLNAVSSIASTQP